jgi:hypothetical protein
VPAGTADTGDVFDMRDFPAGGVLIRARKGLFLARAVNGAVAVTPAGTADTGDVFEMRDLPGVGVLIRAKRGLFLARAVNGAVAVTPAGTADTGRVSDMRDFPGVGMLIHAEKGRFAARAVNGTVTVVLAGTANTGDVSEMIDFPGGGMLIQAEKGLFSGIPTPLSLAKVAIRDKENLDGSLIDANHDLSIGFIISHDCMSDAGKLDLTVRVTAPDNKPADSRQLSPISGSSVAEVVLPWRVDKPGLWSFQVIATSGGMVRPVGELQKLTFVNGLGGNDGGGCGLEMLAAPPTLPNSHQHTYRSHEARLKSRPGVSWT